MKTKKPKATSDTRRPKRGLVFVAFKADKKTLTAIRVLEAAYDNEGVIKGRKSAAIRRAILAQAALLEGEKSRAQEGRGAMPPAEADQAREERS